MDGKVDVESIYHDLVKLIVEVDDLGAADVNAAQTLKHPFIPKAIFKYRLGRYDENGKCWDIENLRNDVIRMTMPEDFNDPYDSAFSIATRANNDIERMVLDRLIYAPARRSMRICCFSESIESMLMWTHYSAEHKGFAIEYNPHEITSVALGLWPVFYRDALFDTSKHLRRMRSSLIPLLPALHKASSWRYEKEWRLIAPGQNDESLRMPRPRAIYMGSNVRYGLERDLKEIAFEKRIKLYRMSHDQHEFKMNMTLVTPESS